MITHFFLNIDQNPKIFGVIILHNGCGMPAGNAYPSGHLVLSPILGPANAPIVETKFLELAMSFLDFSPRIPLGTFSILLYTLCLREKSLLIICEEPFSKHPVLEINHDKYCSYLKMLKCSIFRTSLLNIEQGSFLSIMLPSQKGM